MLRVLGEKRRRGRLAWRGRTFVGLLELGLRWKVRHDEDGR